MEFLKRIWQGIRRISGDDAYERYLKQHTDCQPAKPTLSREEFFKQWQDGKWKGVKRCC